MVGMWRGNRLGASLALLCLLAAACGRLQFRPTGDTAPRAIAFDGLHMQGGARATVMCTESSEIWTVLPNGSGLKQVTKVGHAENPKWSPDGSQILFIRQFTKSKTLVNELWVVGAKGGDAR